MNIHVKHGGETITLDLPAATEVGHIRSKTRHLEDLGVPSNFTLEVNTQGVPDSQILQNGDTVTFRPVSANKG